MILKDIVKRALRFTPKWIFNLLIKIGVKPSENFILSDHYLENFSKDKGATCIKTPSLKADRTYNLKIIVPCYNVENYVDSCIESILRQKTCYSVLLVLVNDGSTDNTLAKLKNYESKNVIVLNQPNKGLSGARNVALTTNNSDFVMFVDSDDCLQGVDVLNNCLNIAYRCRKSQNERIVVEFKHSNIIKKGTIRKKIKNVKYICLSGFAWGKIFSSELFDKIQFPLNYWFEDTVLSTIVFPMADSVFKNKSLLYFYRPNPHGITAKSVVSNKILDTFYITKRLLADRRCLSLVQDYFFDYRFYCQIICNCVRLCVCCEELQQHVFIETCKLFNEYNIGSVKIFKTLRKSIIEKNFKLYRRFCLNYSRFYLS